VQGLLLAPFLLASPSGMTRAYCRCSSRHPAPVWSAAGDRQASSAPKLLASDIS
jgi:hypothetical protein